MSNKHIKNVLDLLLKDIFSSKGEDFAEILINWKKIVGESISSQTTPVKITNFKTKTGKKSCLIISTTKDANLLELKFSELQIIERVNNYLGHNLITSIELR